jgi:hypothetical protein
MMTMHDPLPAQLRASREASGMSFASQAGHTGLSQLTVTAAEGRTDATLPFVALFDRLDHAFVAVPKQLVSLVEVLVGHLRRGQPQLAGAGEHGSAAEEVNG